MLQINRNIKKYRELCGKSQQQMADLLGIKRTTYANWETNTEPELTKLMELAKIFNVHYTVLIEGEAHTQTLKEDKPVYASTASEKHKDEIISLLKKHNDDIMQIALSKDAIVAAINEVKTNLNGAIENQEAFGIMSLSHHEETLRALGKVTKQGDAFLDKARSNGFVELENVKKKGKIDVVGIESKQQSS